MYIQLYAYNLSYNLCHPIIKYIIFYSRYYNITYDLQDNINYALLNLNFYFNRNQQIQLIKNYLTFYKKTQPGTLLVMMKASQKYSRKTMHFSWNLRQLSEYNQNTSVPTIKVISII